MTAHDNKTTSYLKLVKGGFDHTSEMFGGLPPLWRLSVQTDVGGLPELSMDLLLKIRSFIAAPRSFEELQTITKWCGCNSDVCDEKLYYDVVINYIGVFPKVTVPEIPLPFWNLAGPTPDDRLDWAAMFHWHFFCHMTDDRKEVMNKAAIDKTFWHKMMVNCGQELLRLPASMRDPFLNSNEAQRARWESIFSRRGLLWLAARVELGGPIDATPDYGYDVDTFYQFESEHDNRSARNFLCVQCLDKAEEDAFELKVKGFIEEGWLFDWMLGRLFDTPLFDMVTGCSDSERVGYQIACTKHRVQMLIAAGAEPVILAWELMRHWPSTIANKQQKNSEEAFDQKTFDKYHFLKMKVDLLLDNTIYVNFEDENVHESYCVLLTILRCIKEVAAQVDGLTSVLCRLIVHLASPQGSNVHEKVSHDMQSTFVQGFFDKLQAGGTMLHGASEFYDYLLMKQNALVSA